MIIVFFDLLHDPHSYWKILNLIQFGGFRNGDHVHPSPTTVYAGVFRDLILSFVYHIKVCPESFDSPCTLENLNAGKDFTSHFAPFFVMIRLHDE